MMTASGETLRAELAVMSMAGRMAMAVSCLEQVLHAQGLVPGPADDVVDLFWRFVEIEDLSEWEGELVRLQQATDNFGSLALPDWVLQMLRECAVHGDAYICSAIDDDGPESIDAVLRLFGVAHAHGYVTPEVGPFARSSFTERDGWGERHPREYYRQK
jgi:hypothetical protein